MRREGSLPGVVLLALAVMAHGCGDGGPNEAEAYLDQVIGIMRVNALTRNEVDWHELESEVYALADDADEISQTYRAITRALELIDTNHSLLLSPRGRVIAYPSAFICDQDIRENRFSSDTIGFVRVDGFTGSSDDGKALATQIQDEIARQDSPLIEGWIVDLRNNDGGNMWPMVAGLGPLFDRDRLGYFIDADDVATPWGYSSGSSHIDGAPQVTVDTPYRLLNPSPRIAVLSSGRVASSGEATLIAFKKQDNVRMFGAATCGLSTANTPFELSDGSTLLLTTAVTADREREPYGEKVPVDESRSPLSTLSRAVEWLQN